MLQDSNFANELNCTYQDYRQSILDTASIFTYIDSIETLVQNAQERHFQKWPILGLSGPAPEVGAIATTYSAELDTLKAWINLRLQWLDENMPGICLTLDVESQNNPSNNVSVYPNPGNGHFHFEIDLVNESPFYLSIFDDSGRRLEHKEIGSGILHFDCHLKEKGIYFYMLSNKKGNIKTGKLIVY